MPRIYSIKNSSGERFYPDQAKATASAREAGLTSIWSYEPLKVSGKELQVLMLNGSRWWFDRAKITV